MTNRVRVKICGLTRAQDVAAAVAAGADALGFNCYAGSPRHVAAEQLGALGAAVPPFVTPVLLFVNQPRETVEHALRQLPHALLQFHGDEDEAYCLQFGRPYLRAVPMRDEGGERVGLLDWERRFPSALALLADAPAASHGGNGGYGGSGAVFGWQRVPAPTERRKPLVLAGGLTEANVGAAISATRPFAVDVSSGVESGVKGIKESQRMVRFIAAVHAVH